jgi:protein involved in polysaccharide export with SLBB domain
MHKWSLKMFRIYIPSLFVVLLVMCAFSGAQTAQVTQADGDSVRTKRADLAPQTNSTDLQFKERDPRYRVRKSDVIDVKFKFSPEFDRTVRVQPDGFITLDEVGDLKVEDKTLPEVTEAIRRAYQGILHEPNVTVSLEDFDKPFFVAAGQVGHPGKYELRSDITLAEAVAIAGGFTDASKHSQVVLFRHVSKDTVEAKVFNVKQMLRSRNLQEDPHLLPGDMLFVPQNKLSKIQRYIPTPGMGMYVSPSAF